MYRCVALAVLVAMVAAQHSDPEWETYKKQWKKTYKDDADESARYKLFQESKKRVAKLNALNGQPAFGLNWMSDRYEDEKYKKGLKRPADFVPTAPVMDWEKNTDGFHTVHRNPAGIDWRKTTAVTSVKNQGQCGSCWAFSATEAIESQISLLSAAYPRLALSPQQVTSCSPSTGTYGCLGCNGGFTEGAYEYLKSAPGLANEFFIPYGQSLTETTNTLACPKSKVNAINGPMEQLQGGYAQVTGYSYATPPCTQGSCAHQDLKKLAEAIERTPVSICVNAATWNDYTGGVLTSAACGPMGAMYQDHCVMAAGFNSTAPTPYWIVRNSWASTWGEEGYIYLEMAKNTCGLADDATIPTVKLDLSEEKVIEARQRREEMYEQATRGFSSATQTFVI